ncbi:hypothetical protein LIA77_08275 [Sarocladium implicatum]|nr:hypothetical protein LIA77_08275 [Sarocladium implicatum]
MPQSPPPRGHARRPSTRGPRCPRHALSGAQSCSCLMDNNPESSEPPGESSVFPEASSSGVSQGRDSPIRFKSVPDPLSILPPPSQSFYKELVDNQTANVQLARELMNKPLLQGCETIPGKPTTIRPDSEVTFASGILRQLRSTINKFYFSDGTSGPVPNYGVEAPVDVTLRNVVVVFERKDKDEMILQGQTRERICLWATMWRKHMHSIMNDGGLIEPCPPTPVIEVCANGRFYLTFILDTGNEAFALDEKILLGDTNSVEGLCRLRNASVSLSEWKQQTYLPWMRSLVRRVQENIGMEPGG